jgi:hypothetical protein
MLALFNSLIIRPFLAPGLIVWNDNSTSFILKEESVGQSTMYLHASDSDSERESEEGN